MIVIPDAALGYLLLQRTDLLVLPRKKLLCRVACKLSKKPPLMVAVSLESRLRKRAVKQGFAADMQREYADVRVWLPERPTAILDIGCGLGGIDVLLFDHYHRDPDLHFLLLDKTEVSSTIEHGFKAQEEFYNSLALTREILSSSGIPTESLTTIEVHDNTEIEIPELVDLVLSLRSWGFHYPVSTYLDCAYGWLKPGGRLILDVRLGTNGLEEIEAKFGNATVISDTKKKCRVTAIR